MALVSLTLAMVLPLGTATYVFERATYRPEPQAVTVHHDGMVHIPGATLASRQLNLYLYHGNHADVPFMVIKRDEEDFAVALNACGICPARGYHQEGDLLICDNCNAPINLDTVGMPGGCNPIPLTASLASGEVQITATDLAAAQSTFLSR